MYFTKSWNVLPAKIVLITHLLICFKNLFRDLYLTVLCLVHSVSSVAIVFLLWFHNTSCGYQNPMSFYQSLLTTSKETINIASRGHCIGRDRTRIKLQFSRTAGNSHIVRMVTVVNSNCASRARGQCWFCTEAVDIVQPDWSSCRPKPTECVFTTNLIPMKWL